MSEPSPGLLSGAAGGVATTPADPPEQPRPAVVTAASLLPRLDAIERRLRAIEAALKAMA